MPSEERNDYTGPIEDRVEWDQFSKEFLIKLMRLWQVQWETFTNNLMRIGSGMEGIGPVLTGELIMRTMEVTTPPVWEKVAQLAGVDVNTVAGRIKAGTLCMDNIPDNYRGHYEVKSDSEVILKYYRCIVMDERRVGNLDELRYVCQYVEPRYAMAYLNYPNVSRKIKVEMIKIPESLEPKSGEPVCIWRFMFEK